MATFGTRGYRVCQEGTFEEGVEKIAIYTRNGAPQHAARHARNEEF
jgi:hypothetical protein